MKKIEELFRDHLKYITKDQEKWLSLLSKNAVIEFPFAESINMPGKLDGFVEIERYIKNLPEGFEEFEFSNLNLYPHQNPHEISAEFEGRIGDRYKQKYFCYMKEEDGKVVHYREYWNPINVLNYINGGKHE